MVLSNIRCANELVDLEDASGTWYIGELLVKDTVGNELRLGRDDLVSTGLNTSFEVTGGNTDLDAPVLTGLEISPSSVDVSLRPQGVKTGRVNGGRVRYLQCVHVDSVRQPDGNAIQRVLTWLPSPDGDLCAESKLSVEEYAGGVEYTRCANELVFDLEDASGTWYIGELLVKDTVGNEPRLEEMISYRQV